MTFLTNIADIMAKYWKTFLVQGIGYTLLLSLMPCTRKVFQYFTMILAMFVKKSMGQLPCAAPECWRY